MGNLVSLIGKKFSRWEVLSYAGKNSHKHIMWLCRCNCGNEKAVSGNFLRSADFIAWLKLIVEYQGEKI